jgi:hypothetical protein
MFSLFTLIISILSFVGLVYFVYKFVKSSQSRTSIEYRLGIGHLCYSCKAVTSKADFDWDIKAKMDKHCLCKICKRNEDIDTLTGKYWTMLVNRLKFILIKHYLGFSIVHFSIMVALCAIGITMSIGFLSTIVNVANCGYSYVNYRRLLLLTEKNG